MSVDLGLYEYFWQVTVYIYIYTLKEAIEILSHFFVLVKFLRRCSINRF